MFQDHEGYVEYVKLPPDHPSHLDRGAIWDALLHHNLLRKVEQRNDRYKDAAMPVISFDAAFRRLVPTQAVYLLVWGLTSSCRNMAVCCPQVFSGQGRVPWTAACLWQEGSGCSLGGS